MMKTKKTLAKTLPPSTSDVFEAKVHLVRQADAMMKTQEFKTLAEQAAKSSIYFKNYYVAELREKYKHFDRMKRIDKAFPYAKLSDHSTALLLIDEPKNETELELCFKKAEIMKQLGYKYAIIEQDSNLFDVLSQVGAV